MEDSDFDNFKKAYDSIISNYEKMKKTGENYHIHKQSLEVIKNKIIVITADIDKIREESDKNNDTIYDFEQVYNKSADKMADSRSKIDGLKFKIKELEDENLELNFGLDANPEDLEILKKEFAELNERSKKSEADNKAAKEN